MVALIKRSNIANIVRHMNSLSQLFCKNMRSKNRRGTENSKTVELKCKQQIRLIANL
jgi:hypothetical protein